MTHSADLWSIEELISQLHGDEAWTLAVAQRAFEWDSLRVTNLVDSILRGFPIGSLLVAKHDGPNYEINAEGKFRDLNTTPGERTQILDGQQRCKAILATFDGQGLRNPKTGRTQFLWVNVLAPNPRYQAFSREHGTVWLMRWLDRDLHPNALTPTQRRAEKMNLRGGEPETGWIRFDTLVKRQRAYPRTIAKAASASLEQADVAQCILNLRDQVARAWTRQNIPVHRLQPPQEGAAIAELHQVFVRLNVGGKPLSAADEFFAGAKRYWPEAEAGIRPLVDILSPMNRQGSIVLLARIAAHTMNPRLNAYPLRLEVLARTSEGERRNSLVQQMQKLATDDGPHSLRVAVQWLSDFCFHHLACGIHGIGDAPWMAGVAWAYAWLCKNGSLPSVDDPTHARPLCRFLFWTSVLQSHTYGRSGFARQAFNRCWNGGERAMPVPMDESGFSERCFGYGHIQEALPSIGSLSSSTSEADRRKIYALMRRNRWLFLGPFQGVGRGRQWGPESRKQPGMEWEHIVPFNKEDIVAGIVPLVVVVSDDLFEWGRRHSC